MARDLRQLYGDFELGSEEDFADFHLAVHHDRGWHALWRRLTGRRQARFSTDGLAAFTTLPATQAFHMVEWGLNWAVTAHAHHYVVYHAAVLERGGRAVGARLRRREQSETSEAVAELRPRKRLTIEMSRSPPPVP